MTFCAIACIACYLIAILSHNALCALLGCALCGFAVSLFWPGTFSIAPLKLPAGGTAMYAFMALAGDVGCASGSSVVGFVANAFGGNLRAGLLAALIFPVVMLLGITALKMEKKTI